MSEQYFLVHKLGLGKEGLPSFHELGSIQQYTNYKNTEIKHTYKITQKK